MDEKLYIEQIIKEIYPNQSIKILAEGGMSFAFEVGDNIVRIPRNEIAKQDYRKEEKILTYLKDTITTTVIPNLEIIETPFFHIVHKKLIGLHWEGNTYNKLSEKAKNSLANDCACFFSELHLIDITGIKNNLPQIKVINQDVEDYLNVYLSVNEIEAILKHLEILYELPNNVLLHNDFYPPNFFVDTNYRLKSVIDFARACYGDFNFEFRKILSYEEGEQDFWQRIVQFYEDMTHREIDKETMKTIDVYNYMDFLSYFAKHYKIEKGKIRVLNRWNDHIVYVKNKIRELKWI
ncbi:MAG: aminoglycoside phosphotransferase family protein [Planctomycetaceae bacterium]|jgi:predicted Ser/Thr protein kinase|nr:aminoglycoside phosphotransferase family protein [Planctomycetaceae bacterium]